MNDKDELVPVMLRRSLTKKLSIPSAVHGFCTGGEQINSGDYTNLAEACRRALRPRTPSAKDIEIIRNSFSNNVADWIEWAMKELGTWRNDRHGNNSDSDSPVQS